ncbi:conserved hypothetical protein [Ricinus communis]|uniref:Aminotransferase-like plant mobile domain-containing protein n=1 Tax=Ricinus communis TaxID=3988 RepID=B9SR60_RICCO|nr:conserved hypothetical protein [Ricinus communis]
MWWDELPAKVRAWVANIGFTQLASILHPLHVRHDVTTMTMLIEQWSDMKHTFQLHFREMTMTPLDYTALTELQ